MVELSVAGTIAKIVGAVPNIAKWILGMFQPKKLHFVHQRYRRSKGGWGGQSAVNLTIDYWVTSSYDAPIAILRGEVRYWQRFRRRTLSRIQTGGAIPPNIPITFRAFFPLTPAPVSDDEPFKAKIFFIDNFNRRHRAGKFTFAARDPSQLLPPD